MEGEGQAPQEAQAPLDRNEAIVPQGSQPEELSRVTAETVQQKQQERERIYSNLMDEMEGSVGEKGQFFVKFGTKDRPATPNIPQRDTRVLLLIEPVVDPTDGKKLFVAVTIDGTKGLIPSGTSEGSKFGAIINKFRRGGQEEKPEFREGATELEIRAIIDSGLHPDTRRDGRPGRDATARSKLGSLREDASISLKARDSAFIDSSQSSYEFSSGLRPVNPEVVKKAIEESQRIAEIPHDLMLQKEQQKIDDAAGLLNTIKQLPPKQ